MPFLGPGYGTDTDAWRLILTASRLAEEGVYSPSRPPGCPVPEAVFALAWSLAPALPTVLTALANALAAGFFALVLRAGGARDVWLGSLALAFTPAVYIAGTSAMDYSWALMFLMGSLHWTLRGKPLVAGILLGLAIGSRLGTAVLILPLGLLWLRASGEPRRALLRWSAATLVVAVACYLPVRLSYGPGWFSFVQATRSWPLIFYKATVQFWGPVGLAGLAAAATLAWRSGVTRPRVTGLSLPLIWALAAATIVLLFLRLPLESAYLIPAVPFLLLLAAGGWPRRAFQVACLGLLASPFLLAVVPLPDGRGGSGPGVIARGRLGGRDPALTLPGPVPADVWRRGWDIEHARAILAGVDRIRERSVLAVGFELPIVTVLNGMASQRGPVELVVFIRGDRLADYRQRGIDLLYAPGVHHFNLEAQGLDLPALGALPLELGPPRPTAATPSPQPI